jgi:hypothetical protein|tara:strand:+ start:232 stop:414 length:183 start_codon:yes stop_codon:yes gene_type:complete
MSRKITLTTNDIGHRQWAILILELSNMSKTWRRFGVKIDIKAPSSEKIIKWGNRRHDEKE